jgi:hypothetical protein
MCRLCLNHINGTSFFPSFVGSINLTIVHKQMMDVVVVQQYDTSSALTLYVFRRLDNALTLLDVSSSSAAFATASGLVNNRRVSDSLRSWSFRIW